MLTFNQIDLPREVTVGYVRVKVRPYIPNPMRCFQCLRFGHTRADCNNRPTCGMCASVEHTGDDCAAETRRCVNCDVNQKPHTAFDPKCPAFLKEKEILSIKVAERISFKEARERYNAMHPKRSYASVARETPVPRPENHQQQQPGNISQLISLLESFGLRLSGPGLPPGPATLEASHQTAAKMATTATQTSPTREENGSDNGGGRTPVLSHSGSGLSKAAGSGASPPPPPPRPGPPPTAVSEALRRGQEDQRAFEERRNRHTLKAMEAKGSTGVEAAPAPSPDARSPQPRQSLPAEALPLRPPLPPPPPKWPPPPPPKTVTGSLQPTASTPTTSVQSDSAKDRPAKRSLPWEGSPTDSGTARARGRFAPGSTGVRSSSADSRSRQGHARIVYGGSPASGTPEHF